MQRPLTLILIFLCASTAVMAQPELRMEQTNLPPAVGSLMRAGGKVFHRSYMGLHVLETVTQSWRFLGEGSRQFADGTWTVHPNGVVVVQKDNGIIEFDAVTETVEHYDDVWYQIRHSDSLVAYLDVEYENDTTIMRLAWLRWPSMDTARVDEVRIKTDRGYQSAIPCSDGVILAVTASSVIRFHYDLSPVVIKLNEEIASERFTVYSDAERTHIVLTGTNYLVYSTDLFETHTYVSAVPLQTIQQVRLSADPDAIYLAHNGTLERVNRSQTDRDTLRTSQRPILANFEVLQDTVVLGIVDSVLMITGEQFQLANTGLPRRSFNHLASLSGGLIATSAKEVIAHSSGGEWDVLPFDAKPYLIDNVSAIIPMGGNSIDDFWFVARDLVFHVNPRPLLEKVDYGYPGYISRGVHTSSGVSYFTMLYALEEGCGTNQVVWALGNSPVRTLLCKDDLRTLMVFNNSDHVALTRDGIAWRTVDGDIDRWEQIDIPLIASTNIMRTSVSGDHGLARVPNFMMWTHDAGRTWMSVEGNVYYSTITADGTIYTVRRSNDADSMFIVERRLDSLVTTIAVYDTTILSSTSNELRSVAYDEVEQRLYIATTEWTASLSVSVTSVHESHDRTTSAPLLPEGLYDLFGRYVAQDEAMITTSGLYLRVDAEGVRKVMVVR